ncbi:hypothetical protein ACQRIU_006320 [Beauveria bassiana]
MYSQLCHHCCTYRGGGGEFLVGTRAESWYVVSTSEEQEERGRLVTLAAAEKSSWEHARESCRPSRHRVFRTRTISVLS